MKLTRIPIVYYKKLIRKKVKNMRFEFSEQALNNLMIFLDRVDYKGLKENFAINEILNILNNPIKEENKNDLNEK
jgi:hypothetical protein